MMSRIVADIESHWTQSALDARAPGGVWELYEPDLSGLRRYVYEFVCYVAQMCSAAISDAAHEIASARGGAAS